MFGCPKEEWGEKTVDISLQGMCHSTLIQHTVEPCQYSHQWVQKIWLYQWGGRITGAGSNFMTL